MLESVRDLKSNDRLGLRRPLQGLLELLLHDLGALEGLHRLALPSRLRLERPRARHL